MSVSWLYSVLPQDKPNGCLVCSLQQPGVSTVAARAGLDHGGTAHLGYGAIATLGRNHVACSSPTGVWTYRLGETAGQGEQLLPCAPQHK